MRDQTANPLELHQVSRHYDMGGNRVVALFTGEKPTQAAIEAATGINGERIALGPRLIYICYGDGMADSKLKLPAMREGTARNMNSVGKMAELLAGME